MTTTTADEDEIDIENAEQLASKGLTRIKMEGKEEDYLIDIEGNIYDLSGNHYGYY